MVVFVCQRMMAVVVDGCVCVCRKSIQLVNGIDLFPFSILNKNIYATCKVLDPMFHKLK